MIAIDTMRANVFRAPQEFTVEEVERPRPGPGRGPDPRHPDDDLRDRRPHRQGRVPGPARPGPRPRAGRRDRGAGLRRDRLRGRRARPRRRDHARAASATPASPATSRSAATASGYEAIGGWRFGNTIDGAQAEYLLVPSAQANLAKIPDDVTDEQVVLLADIASTGFAGAESGGVRIGDTVVVFAQGPIGLCATAGAKLMGAAQVIGVDSDPVRLAMAKRMGADVALDFTKVDVVDEVKRLTARLRRGRGDRGPRHAADVRERAPVAATRRHAVEPRRLLGQARDAVRGLRRRPRRPPDRDHALPRRQGADGPADRDGPVRPVRPDAAAHPPLPAEPRSARPTGCSATGSTASSRSRSPRSTTPSHRRLAGPPWPASRVRGRIRTARSVPA